MKELLDLEPNDCRYPVNEGGPFLFCAEPSAKGSSYCAHHRDLCFREVMEQLRGREIPQLSAAIRKSIYPAIHNLERAQHDHL